MLSNIYVKNLALIETLSVDIPSGFSVLTGETGAGKSLILDSMNLFLKNKVEKDAIRNGEDYMSASLFFENIDKETCGKISDIFPDFDTKEGILLSRTIFAEGKSSCKINSKTVPFSVANEVASLLFSVSGQNDAVGLQDRKKHIVYLDSSLDKEGMKLKEEYSKMYSEYLNIKSEIEKLEKTDTSPEAVELIEYRIKEIEKAKIKPGEMQVLKDKLEELKNRDKIMQIIATCNKALSGGEKGKGASFLVNVASEKMSGISDMETFSEISSKLREIAEELNEVSSQVAKISYETNPDKNAELIDKITRRLDIIYRASAKYGPDELDIIKSLESLKMQRESALNSGELKETEYKKLQELKNAMKEKADALSEKRREKAVSLEKDIEKVLQFLDMPSTIFKVHFSSTDDFTELGTDKVEFFISANAGEGLKSLSDVASGGELSRVMLSLHLKFGKAKDAPTVVFDEIDTGISGSTSQKIGICLKNLGIAKQVICVTHSAQVSSLADSHFKVVKSEKAGRTQTSVLLLEKNEKINEIARVLSGEKISDEALMNAENLIKQGEELFQKTKM